MTGYDQAVVLWRQKKITNDTREIFEHESVTSYTGDLRTLFEIRGLLSELQDFPEDKVLTAAAYFHAKSEHIHPFADDRKMQD